MSLSTDDDVLRYDPYATAYLQQSETTFERIRGLAYDDLCERLDLMQPSVVASDAAQNNRLVAAEVYCVLHILYREAAARTKEGYLWDVSQYWLRCYERALSSVDTGDLPAVATIRAWRG